MDFLQYIHDFALPNHPFSCFFFSPCSGNIKKLIFAHDTVRVVECLMALGSEVVRAALFAELKDDIIPMAKSKYAYFFVVKMLKYGSKEQRKIIFKVITQIIC